GRRARGAGGRNLDDVAGREEFTVNPGQGLHQERVAHDDIRGTAACAGGRARAGRHRGRKLTELDLRVGPDRVEIQVVDPRGHVDGAARDQVEFSQVDRIEHRGADAAETGHRMIVVEVR